MKQMTKTFDCVEMKREGAEDVYSDTSGMTTEEELSYWDEKTAELLERRIAVGATDSTFGELMLQI